MDSHINNYEDDHEKALKRRSSILKVPKSRNPFEDVDTIDTYSDVSITKPVRRVSFASSNFVKPFVADPEKNTIWDTTYEENVNHTNSTQSSQEHLTKINSTLFEYCEDNITKPVECQMELTNIALSDNKENIAIIPKTTMSLVDYANTLSKSANSNTSGQKFNIFSDDLGPIKLPEANFDNKQLKAHAFIPDVSICGKPPDFKIEDVKSSDSMDMSICSHSINDLKIGTTESNAANLEMNMEYTCQDLGQMSKVEANLEFTCQKPVLSQINEIKEHFEFCRVSTADNVSICENNFEIGSTESNAAKMEMSMEYTCLTPAPILSSKASLESPDNMEFTCQLPVRSKIQVEIKEENLELCQVSRVSSNDTMAMSIDKTSDSNILINSNAANVEMSIERECQSRQILNANSKASSESDNMEFTCQLPRLSTQIQDENEKSFSDNMEFTCQIPIKNVIQLNSKENFDFCQGQRVDTDNMEFTCQIPVKEIQFNTSTNLSEPDFKNEVLQRSVSNKISNSEHFCDNASNLLECSNTINKDLIVPDREAHPKVLKTITDNSLTLSPNRFRNEANIGEATIKTDDSFKGDKTFTKKVESPKSQIPIRRKSTTVHTPQKFHGKKVCDEIKEREGTTERAESLCLSSLKPPEHSFHINLTNISSGIDDTAHLLQCSYSSNKQLSTTRDQSALVMRMDETENATVPNLTDASKFLAENVSGIEGLRDMANSCSFAFSVPNKLSRVNDTYVLRNKVNNEFVEEAQMTEDASLGLLSDECLQSFGDDGSEVALEIKEETNMQTEEENVCNVSFETELEPFVYQIASCSHLIPVWENLKTTRCKIKTFFQTFNFKPFNIPEEFDVEQIDEEYVTSDEEELEPASTVEQRIEERQQSCQKCWRFEKSEGDLYYFSTLFGCLTFTVQLQEAKAETVVNVKTSSKIAVNSKPIARYILHVFLKQMEEVCIRAAIGKHYDLWSLLDYIQMLMLRLHRFQLDFMLDDNVFMEQDFVTKFTLLSYTKSLTLFCEVFVDFSDLENLNFDRDIQFVERVGNVDQQTIVALAKNCSKGLDFVRTFSESLQEYLNKRKENRNIL